MHISGGAPRDPSGHPHGSFFAFARTQLFLVICVFLIFSGPVVVVAGVSSPFLRSNLWIPISLTILGGTGAVLHAMARRTLASWIIGPMLEGVALVIIIQLFLSIRIPQTGAVPESGHPLSFTLSDPDRTAQTLASLQNDRPAVLVFFRGTW